MEDGTQEIGEEIEGEDMEEMETEIEVEAETEAEIEVRGVARREADREIVAVTVGTEAGAQRSEGAEVHPVNAVPLPPPDAVVQKAEAQAPPLAPHRTFGRSWE